MRMENKIFYPINFDKFVYSIFSRMSNKILTLDEIWYIYLLYIFKNKFRLEHALTILRYLLLKFNFLNDLYNMLC